MSAHGVRYLLAKQAQQSFSGRRVPAGWRSIVILIRNTGCPLLAASGTLAPDRDALPPRRETGSPAERLVRDAVWLRKSLDEAEQEAAEAGWLTTEEVRCTLAAAAEAIRPSRGRRSR